MILTHTKDFCWGKKKRKKLCYLQDFGGGKKHLPNSSTMVPMCSQNIKRILLLFTCVSDL